MRRLWLFVAVGLAVGLVLAVSLPVVARTGGDAGSTSGPAQRRDEPPVSREDVLAGRASQAQALDLLRASVEAAGGEAVSPPPTAVAAGGWAYPIMAVDLDGDGDDEILLSQYVDRPYLVAVDDRGVLWRVPQPKNSFLLGALPADLMASAGQEALLFAFRFKQPARALVAAAGADGVQWGVSIPAGWLEVNGLVQADGDPSDEVALTIWGTGSESSIHTLNGEDGAHITVLRSTIRERLPVSWASQGFVTDGPPGQVDEAVFLTAIPTGFYAERRSLADGSQATFRVAVNESLPQLYQGSDYTGDGRRDAYLVGYPSYGVFDAAALRTAWSLPGQSDEFPYPYRAGDLDGDGGTELCVTLSRWVGDVETMQAREVGAGARCHAGSTGAQLWETLTSWTLAEGEDGYAYTDTGSDLDGDGRADPVSQFDSYECVETPEYPSCTTVRFEAVAASGVDGSALWGLSDPAAAEWWFTESNLDGSTGDDGLDRLSAEHDTPDAQFAVRNGMTLTQSWRGEIDTGDLPGYVSGAVSGDLDGDGTPDAVVTAGSYEVLGDPQCVKPCLFVEYAYVAAFGPNGKLLWQLEL